MSVLKEIERKTPIGTRLAVKNGRPDNRYEVTGHQYPSSDQLEIDLCTPTGKETKFHYQERGTSVNGNIIESEGCHPVEIENSRD